MRSMHDPSERGWLPEDAGLAAGLDPVRWPAGYSSAARAGGPTRFDEAPSQQIAETNARSYRKEPLACSPRQHLTVAHPRSPSRPRSG